MSSVLEFLKLETAFIVLQFAVISPLVALLPAVTPPGRRGQSGVGRDVGGRAALRQGAMVSEWCRARPAGGRLAPSIGLATRAGSLEHAVRISYPQAPSGLAGL